MAGSRNWLMRLLGYGLAALVVVTSALTFHYYNYFGQYPGSGIAYYLAEIETVGPSIMENVPVHLVAFGGLLGVLLLAGIHRLSSSRESGQKQTRAARLTALFLLASAIGLGTLPWVSDRWRVGATEAIQAPLLHFVASGLKRSLADVPEGMPDARLFLGYQHFIGHGHPFASLTPGAPLCGLPARLGPANGRSVIFVMLESVGQVQLEKRVAGKWLMPNLRAIAEDADAVHFTDLYASGTKSNQAMTAVFSGLPPQVDVHMLWQQPLPASDSLVSALREDGYSTVYMHGSDLSFEQQRVYLQQTGFEELVEPEPSKPHQVIGWGYDDAVMFGELRGWIEEHRTRQGDVPFYAAIATLTSHDPYFLPETWKPRLVPSVAKAEFRADWSKLWQEGHGDRELEAFHYLDHQLESFYRWYETHEKPRGTLLVMVGDHLPGSVYRDEGSSLLQRYRVPFIVVGEGLPARRNDMVTRTGSQFDIHRTLTELLGKSARPCDQGLNLFAQETEWPEDRLVYSVEGDFNQVALFSRQWSASLDRATGVVRVELRGQGDADPDGQISETAAQHHAVEFLSTLFPVMRYVESRKAYALQRDNELELREPLVRGSAVPILVSHRGNSRGLIVNRPPENSREALQQALSDGFTWAEVDVQITRDGIPVLHHDPFIDTNGKHVPISKLTRAQLVSLPCCGGVMTLEQAIDEFGMELSLLVEAKPQRHIMHSLALETAIGEVLQEASGMRDVIIDSFSSKTAAAIRRICNCEGGLDLPQDVQVDDGWLQHVVNLGLDWVYLEKRMVNADVVRLAHDYGLKVMVYTVNDTIDLARWGDAWPDGIITDDRRIREAVNEHFKSLGLKEYRAS
jgi:glycerophosphoryl diester phosphodiesterase/arylsulfatase A-like enzyme